jgi:death-on-curing protein
LVGIFLPFNERVNPAERRDKAAIESALGRPFQTICGEEAWPTLSQKAAALFHSLICNHCFINGNKRTAVIALDMFVISQYHILAMSSDEVYAMAKDTAQANQDGKPLDSYMAELAAKIEASLVDISILDDPDIKQRLGGDYARVIRHAKRALTFAVTSIESFTEQKIVDRKAYDEFMAMPDPE